MSLDSSIVLVVVTLSMTRRSVCVRLDSMFVSSVGRDGVSSSSCNRCGRFLRLRRCWCLRRCRRCRLLAPPLFGEAACLLGGAWPGEASLSAPDCPSSVPLDASLWLFAAAIICCCCCCWCCLLFWCCWMASDAIVECVSTVIIVYCVCVCACVASQGVRFEKRLLPRLLLSLPPARGRGSCSGSATTRRM